MRTIDQPIRITIAALAAITMVASDPRRSSSWGVTVNTRVPGVIPTAVVQ